MAEQNPNRNRLLKQYKEEIVPALLKEKGYKNVNEVPALEKIIVNMRFGDIKDNSKSVSGAVKELEAICGQKAVLTTAKKSVANFKLREGQTIGAKVTLRGTRMYEFFDKLVSIALPRVRDFRGISSKSFDGRGNYTVGVKEHIIFPEVSYELVEKVRGFDVCVVTSAKTDDEARALLVKLGMPFKN
jgi:large subunit ribosomal protein L5